MKILTDKEASIMDKLWRKNEELITHEIMDMFPEPRPKLFTVSAFLRILVEKGWVTYSPIGNTYLYKATISREEAGRNVVNRLISKFFNGSISDMVSSLINDESIGEEELKELLDIIEQNEKYKKDSK